MNYDQIHELIGEENEHLLEHRTQTFGGRQFYKPHPGIVDDVFGGSDRSNRVLRNLGAMYNHGRLAKTGYLSILPVDQGIEHSAGASFAANPNYFDPEQIIHLAIDGGSSAVTSSIGVLSLTSRKFAHQIPYVVKLNHNELLTYPNKHDQIMFADVRQAWELGAVGVGATIYFGSPESNRQITEVSAAFAEAHRLGMFTILWCYTRNTHFKKDGVDYHTSADISGQAIHLGASIGADIIKQKLPELNGGVKALNSGDSQYGKLDERIYRELSSDHPIDLTRYQVANAYSGKIPLLSSGGPSVTNSDGIVANDANIKEAVIGAIINKRAGGSGLILGRKAFQTDLGSAIRLLNAVQDVYLERGVTVA